jgi:hypothetical protein
MTDVFSITNDPSGLLRLVALVRIDVSEERSVSNIRVIRVSELGTLAVTSNGRPLRSDIIHSISSQLTPIASYC